MPKDGTGTPLSTTQVYTNINVNIGDSTFTWQLSIDGMHPITISDPGSGTITEAVTTPSLQILPLDTTGTYDFYINWGDGSAVNHITSYGQAETAHLYPSKGTYKVNITGTFKGWVYNGQIGQIMRTIECWGPFQISPSGCFVNHVNLVINATDIPNMTGITNMSNAFNNCGSIISIPNMHLWDMSAVTNISGMFANSGSFNQDISAWNTGNVINMHGVFNGCTAFNSPLNSWNTSKVTDMSNMFGAARAFNQPLNSWDVSKVTTMNAMFASATSFNQNIGGWTTTALTNTASMFSGATVFNQNLNSWNMASVTDTNNMFSIAPAFNQPLNSWNMANVTNSYSMFNQATAFNQPLNSWNMAKVTNMSYMFQVAQSFNQDLSAWNVTACTNMYSMFSAATSYSTANYNALLIGWAAEAVKNSVSFNMNSTTKYSAGAAKTARFHLTGTHLWSITDGGQE